MRNALRSVGAAHPDVSGFVPTLVTAATSTTKPLLQPFSARSSRGFVVLVAVSGIHEVVHQVAELSGLAVEHLQ